MWVNGELLELDCFSTSVCLGLQLNATIHLTHWNQLRASKEQKQKVMNLIALNWGLVINFLKPYTHPHSR